MHLLLLYLFISFSSHADMTCEKWFLKSKIIPGSEGCAIECSALMVDMGTFTCPSKCKELCQTSLPNLVVDTVGYKKGITEGDKKMIAKYPLDAIKVFQTKEKAEDIALKIFKTENTNDESDAFRHFVWAGLVVAEVGVEKAQLFLDAHEQDPTLPKEEVKMDKENNRQGLQFATTQKTKGEFPNISELEKEALKRLKAKKLSVLKPSGKNLPKGYYSGNR